MLKLDTNKIQRATDVFNLLEKATKGMPEPMSRVINEKFGGNPFLILISCLLSLRAKDSVTLPICLELFKIAKTPQEILDIPDKKLEKIIYKTGFYKKKAAQLKHVSQVILEKYNGIVPDDKQELLSIKGIGIKTANLVLGEAFKIPAICVDTHVHKISNRLGLVKTNTPAQTEKELEKLLPKKYWIDWNYLLVKWGQNICVPVSPFCSKCVLNKICPRIGVTKSR